MTFEDIKRISSTIDFSKFNDVSYMFSECTSITYFDFSIIDLRNATDFGAMLSDCTNLTNVSGLDSNNLQKIQDVYAMFYNCSSLKNIDISKLNTSKIQYFGMWFSDCNNLETINGIIDMSSVILSRNTGYSNMFNGCTKLSGVKIKNAPSSFPNEYNGSLGGLYDGAGLTPDQYEIVS